MDIDFEGQKIWYFSLCSTGCDSTIIQCTAKCWVQRYMELANCTDPDWVDDDLDCDGLKVANSQCVHTTHVSHRLPCPLPMTLPPNQPILCNPLGSGLGDEVMHSAVVEDRFLCPTKIQTHQDWPGKQWRAERQACRCTRLTARFRKQSSLFEGLFYLYFVF